MSSFNEFYEQIAEEKETEKLQDVAANLIVLADVEPEVFLTEFLKNYDFEDQIVAENIFKNAFNRVGKAVGDTIRWGDKGFNKLPESEPNGGIHRMDLSGRDENEVFSANNDPKKLFIDAVKVLEKLRNVYAAYGATVTGKDGQKIPFSAFLNKVIDSLKLQYHRSPDWQHFNKLKDQYNAHKQKQLAKGGVGTAVPSSSGTYNVLDPNNVDKPEAPVQQRPNQSQERIYNPKDPAQLRNARNQSRQAAGF